jgi:prepilin-type N-terminal cleavage/methylation domain-containing protein
MNMRRNSRGYSVVEMLVVVAIIGILSLVTVPAFMNFQRRNAVRSALRSFTSDIRSYRQHAITKNAYVRVQFRGERDYVALQSRDFGQTWRPLKLGPVNEGSDTRTLPETIAITANTYNDSDTTADGLRDIDFRPDGRVGDFDAVNAATAGTITLRTNWTDILNTVAVDISTTGQIKTTESKS